MRWPRFPLFVLFSADHYLAFVPLLSADPRSSTRLQIAFTEQSFRPFFENFAKIVEIEQLQIFISPYNGRQKRKKYRKMKFALSSVWRISSKYNTKQHISAQFYAKQMNEI